ncbi:hypothetical protein ARAM_005217 [Aspergillus rambellii]|uniref:SHSP domain-containing protein n=1 Tax=Aspergillus rambellii TaxID=308745 RepID=A0A0F8VDN0_9EURO|nr:hypothetical protein ARAM_005217 [Aspergillus rambellii]
MAFFPRCSGDFAPLFQLLDDYDVHRTTRRPTKKTTTVRSFAPKFDVYELDDCYYLDGEVPGADQEHIEIEFTDPQTLVIKGRTERNYHKKQAQPEHADDGSDETSSVKSHQATVEDWDEMTDTTPPAESSTNPAPIAEKTVEQQQSQTAETTYKLWVSERSIGEFQRTFAFPARVDQDSVRANLKDGVLSVVVPKEPAPKVKKIRVE